MFDHFVGLALKGLKDDLLKANNHSVLCDGSTDKIVTEQDVIFVLFLQDSAPKLRYFSNENIENANAVGDLSSINTTFERFGIINFEKSLLDLNCDHASVNNGAYGGLGALLKENIPWLELVHFFNHRIKLVLNGAIENSVFFKIENMLMKLYNVYQESETLP